LQNGQVAFKSKPVARVETGEIPLRSVEVRRRPSCQAKTQAKRIH